MRSLVVNGCDEHPGANFIQQRQTSFKRSVRVRLPVLSRRFWQIPVFLYRPPSPPLTGFPTVCRFFYSWLDIAGSRVRWYLGKNDILETMIFWKKWYLEKTIFGKNDILLEKMIFCWKKWYFVGKNDILLEKMIFCWKKWYFVGKNDILLEKMIFCWKKWYFVGKNDILLEKMIFCWKKWYFVGKNDILEKMIFWKKWYFGKNDILGEKMIFWGKMIFEGNSVDWLIII